MKRFQQICVEKNIKTNQLAVISGITASSVYSMMDESRENVSIVLIKQLCDGLDLPLHEFFHDELFFHLELEIE
ncbi:MAG: helix-turn-helix domain-containing protein [Oscillospiraceae bacterium]